MLVTDRTLIDIPTGRQASLRVLAGDQLTYGTGDQPDGVVDPDVLAIFIQPTWVESAGKTTVRVWLQDAPPVMPDPPDPPVDPVPAPAPDSETVTIDDPFQPDPDRSVMVTVLGTGANADVTVSVSTAEDGDYSPLGLFTTDGSCVVPVSAGQWVRVSVSGGAGGVSLTRAVWTL